MFNLNSRQLCPNFHSVWTLAPASGWFTFPFYLTKPISITRRLTKWYLSFCLPKQRLRDISKLSLLLASNWLIPLTLTLRQEMFLKMDKAVVTSPISLGKPRDWLLSEPSWIVFFVFFFNQNLSFAHVWVVAEVIDAAIFGCTCWTTESIRHLHVGLFETGCSIQLWIQSIPKVGPSFDS